MRKLLLPMLLCIAPLFVFSQNLNFSIPGNRFTVKNDTIYIEKNPDYLAFEMVYAVSGTNKPVTIRLSTGLSSTLDASQILRIGTDSRLNTSFILNDAVNYSGRISFSLSNSSMFRYSSNEYFDIIFSWPDLLNTAPEKTKRLVLHIHKLKKKYWRQKDPSNTPKLELIQYTDFLGINSDRPNGVFQQQLLFKWPINKTYWPLCDNFKVQLFRSVLIPNVLLNRIDKAKDDSSVLVPLGMSTVLSPNSSIPDTVSNVVSSFDLIRYANTIIESSVNILTLHVDRTRIYLNYNIGLVRNRIYDTISQEKPVSRPIYSRITGWHVYVKSVLDPKASLNIELEGGYRRVNLKDNFFKQYDVYAYENGRVKSIRFPVQSDDEKMKSKPIYYVSTKLSKDWGKESTNYIFLRFKYQWQSGHYKFYSKGIPDSERSEQFTNHFFQVNLGVSLGLEDLFKK